MRNNKAGIQDVRIAPCTLGMHGASARGLRGNVVNIDWSSDQRDKGRDKGMG